MKTLTLVFGLIISSFCSAQEPVAAIQSPELSILYRGYPNKVIPAVTNNKGKKVELFGSNCRIEKVENSNEYHVFPSSGRTASLSVVLVDGSTIDTISTTQYRVSNMPVPSLYWGGAINGGEVNSNTTQLFVKFPSEIPLNSNHRITNWEIQTGSEIISGIGADISSAQSFIKKIPNNEMVIIAMTVLGSDGILRKMIGSWKLVHTEE